MFWNNSGIIRLAAGAVILTGGIVSERFFDINAYITLAIYAFDYIFMGGVVLLMAVRNILKGRVFDENFLMAIATIGAFAIGEYAEAVGVMLFFQAGEFLQESAAEKSRRTIAGLMDIRPDFANLLVNGVVSKVAPETVKPGDLIIVKPGERIPIDGVVVEGTADLDTSALTGEPIPRKVSATDPVLSGCINMSGLLTVKVTKEFRESTVSKILELVERAAEKKAPTENFITKFARYYTPAVVGLAALICTFPPLILGGEWSDWVYRSLVFLVISCPCALVISIPLGYFGGIGSASRKGILIKGGNYLEALNDLDIVVFDKTGTLTKGVFEVTEVRPADGFSPGELMEAAAKAEAFSNHPIALSVMREYGKSVDKSNLAVYSEIAGHGVSVNANGRRILAGNAKLMEKEGILYEESDNPGAKVYVSIDGLYAGLITVSDEIRPDSFDTISALKAKGVRKTAMLSGDSSGAAYAVASNLGIEEFYGGLLPHQKVEKVETLSAQRRPKGVLAFVGDGINDAPVLAISDVGIAMGGLGSDAAIEAADIVLMTDEPSKLIEAIVTARFTKRVVWQNIIFAIGVKILFLALGAAGIANMWEAVFADVGVALLAILNAMRVMYK